MPSLTDRTVAITRSEQEASEFLQMVKSEGGIGIAVPTTEIVSKGKGAAIEFMDLLREKRHDYCAFMSAQAVKALFSLAEKDEILSALGKTSVIAVGPKTRLELERHGLRVDLMPEKYSSIGLLEFFSKMNQRGKKIIIPRSGASNEFATDALSKLGMTVDQVFLYTVRTADVTAAWQEFYQLLVQKKIDAVVFTSASNVRSFFEILGKLASDRIQLDELTEVISIGPFTTKELDAIGVRCKEADEHTVKGTLDLAKAIFSHRR